MRERNRDGTLTDGFCAANSHLILFPQSEEDYGAFLISQMHLNSELSQQLDAIVRRLLLSCTLNKPTP
jgi:hypothetical protein